MLGTEKLLPPELFKFSSGLVPVSKCGVQLRAWAGSPLKNDYGRKQALDSDGEATFAELVILRSLRKEGYDGAWVDSFRRKFWSAMSEQCLLPTHARALYDQIVHANGNKYGGCWDVFAWKQEEQYLFIEAKRHHKDKITDNEKRWLEAAMSVGIAPSCFLVCEWDI